MTIKNRTTEFQAVVRTIKNRQSPLNGGNNQVRKPENNKLSKGEFSKQASVISQKIQVTAQKLQDLTKLAKRKTLFDDRPNEINELTFAIKQDIANINQQLSSLQQLNKSGRSGVKQQDEHQTNVVANLQNQLANASMSFKDVLEIRSENIKATNQRKEQFVHQSSSFHTTQSTNGMLPDPQASPDYLALDLGDPELQQMQLIERQDSYVDNRAAAINNIESTIAELGSVFQQLATMVAEQRDVVQRIDANVESIETNVTGAQTELLQYYASISDNRWLILKVFGVVLMFLVLFAMMR